MLEFRNISHAYNGTPSVNDISLTVNKSEVVTLLGPSGCGKTTLLRLAAGLERPLTGEICLMVKSVGCRDDDTAGKTRRWLYVSGLCIVSASKCDENVVFGLPDKGSLAMRRGLMYWPRSISRRLPMPFHMNYLAANNSVLHLPGTWHRSRQ